MNTSDITLNVLHGKFNYRIAYLAFQDNKILLQKNTSENYWFLTGGRVSFGDTTQQTVVREIAEELSLNIHNMELAAFIENFFTIGSTPYHEISTYYRVTLPDNFPPPTHEANGDPIELAWHNINQLDHIDIRPAFLKTQLENLKQGFHHLIQQD